MMPETTIDRATPVFVARALTKIYQMGEVRVDALRGIDFDLELGHQTGQEAEVVSGLSEGTRVVLRPRRSTRGRRREAGESRADGGRGHARAPSD
jgi:hypothetical protein